MGGERLIPLACRYRLISVVGSGGMGTVWRAHDEMLDRDVAVKEVHLPEGITQGERGALCRRLIGEARATAALRHPGVVDVYDVVVEDGRPWIVMELLRARSLHQVVAEDGPLSVARTAAVGRAVLSVLRAAHDAGILHRDVKPSNVLLCDDGRILLTDFGLAVHTGRGGDEIAETLVAGIEGSPAYLPPERVRGGPSLEASDLWALGATLYAAVEGEPPFLRCHALASMLAVLLGEYAAPVRAGALAPLICGLLSDDPAGRPSADAAGRLLRTAARSRSRSAATLPVEMLRAARRAARRGPLRARSAARVARRGRPRFGAVISVATLAVLVIGFGTWTARWTSIGTSEAVTLFPAPEARTGTVPYREAGAYTVEIPAGWQREQRGAAVEWRSPGGGQGLRIGPAPGDPLDGLRAAETDAAARDLYPGYRRLRLEPAPELADGAAEWEFAWDGTGRSRGGIDASYGTDRIRGAEGAGGGAGDGRTRGDGGRGDGVARGTEGASGSGGSFSVDAGTGAGGVTGRGVQGAGGANGAGGTEGRHGLRSRAAGYEFFFFAPESSWTPGQRLFDKILKSFRPERPS
ncbi:serine/threonine-protein kinase [Spirillospora sp. NBC_01491]|nr:MULTISPECIES: serine/threonine-protein kinase [Thermomonosporaceae]MDL4773257.1 serine/threonine-protein kinase [Actinomadura xylanilytica]